MSKENTNAISRQDEYAIKGLGGHGLKWLIQGFQRHNSATLSKHRRVL
jgi:hypothetical protein